jgi:alkylation response protein AidB-like acyl-CoA dehydrogenase
MLTELIKSDRVKALLPAIQAFMVEEVFPYDLAWSKMPFGELLPTLEGLRQKVKANGWWLPCFDPHYGGMGLGLMEHAFVSEAIGGSPFGYYIFNCQAPDIGNMELLHLAGTDAQKEKYLQPLAAGEFRSCFAMTEPEYAGSNPVRIGTTAQRDGDEYVINGHKWFTTGFDGSELTIVMAVTDPAAAPYQRASMIIVPTATPGLQLIRNLSIMGHAGSGWPSHSEIRFDNVRVPVENLLGAEGAGFMLAQVRLGPGRIHHCMRWMGICERAFELMCRYAATREIEDGVFLGEKQMVQQMIAESRAEIDAAKLMVLSTALLIEKAGQRAAAEKISAIKFFTAKVLGDVLDRAIQVHGGLGITDDTILALYYREERAARIYDGTDETHKASLARKILKKYTLSMSNIQ